jgi:SAM-dependent methyltransferase
MIDLGCGTKPYRKYFSQVSNYIGVDIEQSGNPYSKQFIDIFYDGKTLPFEDNFVENVFSSEVFEHVFNLEELIPEIHRVLKPDGTLIMTCPFAWPEHEQPYDYARYTSFGIQHLLSKNNFEISQYIKTGNYLSSLIQLLSMYLYYFIARIPILKHLLFLLIITPLFLIAQILTAILPKRILRNDLYMNNVIIAKKKI